MKIPLLLFITFLFYSNTYAQIEFQEHTIADNSYTVIRPESVFSIDLDNDGDLDALSASIDKIAWYENMDGLGNFGIQQILEVGDVYATSIYSVDIDGDGDNDVISTLRLADEIVWYENTDGKGNFSSKKVITNSADWGTSVYAIDIDGDGDIDVISASQNDNKIAWYENTNGLGNFSSQKIITTNASGAQFVYASDIDNDGDMDIISASKNDHKIAWYENTNGLGNFTTHVITTGATDIKSIHVNDFDNDGDMDILYAKGWYENTDGLGNFTNNSITNNYSSLANIAVYSKDIDGDGDIDVIIDNMWYENTNGLGDFESRQTLYNGDGVKDIYLSDMDNDGKIDALFALSTLSGLSLDKIAWSKNIDGLGNFTSIKSITIDNQGIKSIYSSDIDGDGDMDIIGGYNYLDNKIVWYENTDGLGIFGDEKIITTQANGVSFVFSADIDGDGDMDVLSASTGDYKVAWYENMDGLGSFGTQRIISIINGVGSYSAYASDMDGDGDIDVISHSSNGTIGWFENLDGLGNFGARKIILSTSDNLAAIYIDDIDNDGDIDIIIASFVQNKISWIENISGQGDFGPQQTITTDAVGARSIYTADINGDGYKDVISASSDNINVNKKVAWYENMDGQGAFGSQQIISTSLRVGLVSAADLDNDNDIDVIATSAINNTIIWYENMDGQGNFSTQQIISDRTVSNKIPSICIVDIDGDYNKDIIYSSTMESSIYYPQLAWYKNSGTLFNIIKGSVKIDVDSNGCDITDLPMPNLMVQTNDGINNFATFTQNNGDYTLFTKEGNYTTTTSTLPAYLNATPNSQSSIFIGYNNINDDNDFCLEFTQTINDANISLYPKLEARPGFDTEYRLVYKNAGTIQLSGSIVFEFNDSKLIFLTASEAIISQTANSLTFNYNNLKPFETRFIDLNFSLFTPPTTNINDILIFNTTIHPVSGDNTENDNVFELNQTVIGSYDPNDIAVLEGSQILFENANEYLHYIIRFQNTGTASAINVKVNNLLNDKLDWTTMQLESSSHTNRVEIKNGNEVSFIFNGIYLPDSTSNEPNSHGFIAYKIKPKSDVIVGDILPNQADIIFDFNPAIITNMVTTEITSSLSVGENLISRFYVYPNPTKEVLNIKSKSQITKLEIYNNIGQVVLSQFNKKAIDVSTLSSGLYFIKIKDENGNSETKKIIKE